MTGNEDPPARDAPAPADHGAADSHAEQVLSQALRLMAGGGTAGVRRSDGPERSGRQLTTGQLLLLAAIVGLLVGLVAGFLSLM